LGTLAKRAIDFFASSARLRTRKGVFSVLRGTFGVRLTTKTFS